MRYLAIIFLMGFLAFSCVKPNTDDPIPSIEFKGIQTANKAYWPSGSTVSKGMFWLPPNSLPARDSASLVLHYQDGDGDLFLNSSSEGPNFVFISYYWDAAAAKFVQDVLITQSIIQPSNGYYKGKSVQGNVEVPMKEFRSDTAHKIIKFEGFMIDMSDHKTNVVTSPVYTLEAIQ